MGAIRTSASQSLRDFQIAGVPASGAHDPEKAALRATFGLVEDEIARAIKLSTTAGTTKVVSTVADLAGIEGMADNDRAEVRADPLGDVEDGNGVWRYDAATEDWIWLSSLFPDGAVDAFQDAVLSPSRKVPLGKNKFVAARVTEGFEVYGDGSISPQPDSSISDPIWVAGEPVIFLSGIQAHDGFTPYARWLAEDAQTVVGDAFQIVPGADGAAYAPPAGAYYVQFSPRQRAGGAPNYGAVQLEYSSVRTVYAAPVGGAYLTLAADPIYSPQGLPSFDGDVNLFNPASVTMGLEVYGDGSLQAQTESLLSGLIDVRDRRRLTISGLPVMPASAHYWRVLDAAGVVVGVGSVPAGVGRDTVVIPASGVAFQFSPRQRQAGAPSIAAVQVEEGPVVTTFQAFRPRVTGLNRRNLGARPRARGDGGVWALAGDSKTTQHTVAAGEYSEAETTINWSTYFRDLIQADGWHNLAASGASYRHRVGLTAFQKISEQVTRLIETVDHIDRMVFAAGDNDGIEDVGDFATAMGKADLEDLDQTKLYEALRWNFWSIRIAYPKVVGFAELPLQRADVEPSDRAALNEAITRMAQRYCFHVVDATYKSGIVRDFETWGAAGRFLYDGHHTNDAGKRLQADLWDGEVRKVLA